MNDRKRFQRPPNKAEKRLELEREIAAFLNQGGTVHKVPNGVSGHDNPTQSPFAKNSPIEPRQERTPLTEVVKAIDERKKPEKKPVKLARSGPKKKLLKDDFGEPIRWVWED